MSESHTDHEPNATTGRGSPRYASFETEDGDCVLYDTENQDAWIQANSAVARVEVR